MPTSALIVIDMINTYEHEDGDLLARSVERSLPAMVRMIERAGEEDVHTIYVNDSWGLWTSDRDQLLERALSGPRADLVEPIRPDPEDWFTFKARHSIFYQTVLEYLLRTEGIERVVLIGQVTEQCILYSALDAYIRHFEVAVPADAIAHIHEQLAEAALEMMRRNMRADITTSEDCALR
jgi:nicotinamidase-related amidase